MERQNPLEKIPKTLRLVVWGTDPTLRRNLLGLKSKVGTITDLERGEKSNPLSYPQDEADPWNIKVIHKKGVPRLLM